ncbi:MAG: dihydropteroate synthase [Rhodospirillales bacterium 70-18]|nr:dihydropteroate synthase [Rhodospirillales bacterium]OJY64800.1 MAG: dihydropteroate synthase [Rhodospirillales bacterium 70-18]
MPLLVEPLGLLHGPAATQAIAEGLALPLAGGPSAFALVRLVDEGAAPGRICPVAAVPAAFRAALVRVSAAPPPWAGMPADRPLVMGILNVTPDSFSDGGAHADADRAIEAGLEMAAEGADLVDVGGESTRPRAAPTPPDEECARVVPVIRALAARGVAVSVDTRNAATMRAALAAGARVVNDVSALAHDPDAAGVVAEAACPVILMHMRGDPATMHTQARYDDVAVEVTRELAARIAAAEAAGIRRAAIAVDPGIGFAKAAAENLALLPRLSLLLNLGCPIVVGVSRKGFIGGLAGEPVARRRGPGSLAAGLHAALHGAAMLRVHDVAATAQAVRVWRGLLGLG